MAGQRPSHPAPHSLDSEFLTSFHCLNATQARINHAAMKCRAADRRQHAKPGRAGQRQRVEAAAEKKQARDQQPRGPCESLRCRPLRHKDAHAEEPQRVPEVILNRGLIDGERFGREPGFDGVRAERAERDRRDERGRGRKHTQTGVHWLASSLSTIETTKLG